MMIKIKKASKAAESMNTWADGVSHVHLDLFSINIIRTDEGVVVDIWEKDFRGGEPLASTYSFESELNSELEEE